MFFQMLKSAHFYKTWAHAFVAASVAFFLGIGVHAPTSLPSLLFSAGAFSLVMLLGGLGSTIFSRGFFGLAQVGIFIQLAMFWVSGMIAAWLVSMVLPLAVTSFACISATTMVGYIILAVPTGHIQQYANRSWMPVKMPKQ